MDNRNSFITMGKVLFPACIFVFLTCPAICGDIVQNYKKFTFGEEEDNFGKSVSSLGDLDGDGVDDIAVGAWKDDDGATDAGAVWILFMKPDGTPGKYQKISALSGGFQGPLTEENVFGMNVASIGDLDDDGITDIVVGAPWDSDGGTYRGAVWILFLNTDGTVKQEQKISDLQGNFTGTLKNWSQFGCSANVVEDMDGDGIQELVVGSWTDEENGLQGGSVWILFMTRDGTVKSHQKINQVNGGFSGDLKDGDLFGASVCSLGDMDGDGNPEIAVGATGDSDGGAGAGAVWILYLREDGTVKKHVKLSANSEFLRNELDEYEYFGRDVSVLNTSLTEDVILGVGCYGHNDGNIAAGAVRILQIQKNGKISRQILISQDSGGLGDILGYLDNFGTTLSFLKKPGETDDSLLMVGAQFDDEYESNAGAVYTLFLDDLEQHIRITKPLFACLTPYGDVWGAQNQGAPPVKNQYRMDWLGYRFFPEDGELPLVGDVNGDGKKDLIQITRWGDAWAAIRDYETFAGPVRWGWLGFFYVESEDGFGNYPMCGDVDGDGDDDLILVTQYTDVWTSLSGGEAFETPHRSGWLGFYYFRGNQTSPGGLPIVGDFNGDGKCDLAQATIYGDVWVSLSGGNSFGVTERWGWLDFYFQPLREKTIICGDFNGDGVDDLGMVDNGDFRVSISDGASFGAPRLWNPRPECGEIRYCEDQGFYPVTADVNMDGKMDVIQYESRKDVIVHYSLGDQLDAPENWGNPNYSFSRDEGLLPFYLGY